ncbi:MFS transporter [Nocardioides bruguierae]|uniref:MFS transporter n=1 Tax=Nocardioides bruguierae TaxID=2945102 RepID=A0A9X2DAW3_9ACTN|nr:MFS transporter [Nocardioides bruguierae]MCM0622527.1 MFS transporter [Nocardioides bruguierae]
MALRALVDLSAVKQNPAFRRFWVGSSLSQLGSQVGVFAVTLQVYSISGSAIALGAVGAVYVIPMLTLALLGGAIGDSRDRKFVLLVTGIMSTALSALFWAQAHLDISSIVLLFVLVFVQSSIGAIQVPVRRAVVPNVVNPDQLGSAIASINLSKYVAQALGPLLAGVIISTRGFALCYLIDSVSFAIALYSVVRLPSMPAALGNKATPMLSQVAEGVNFVIRSRVLRGTFFADLSITLLGMPLAILPVVNDEFFEGAPEVLGILTAATAVGGTVGSALSGSVSHSQRPGKHLVQLCLVWGILTMVFGVSRSVYLSCALLAIMGALDALAVSFCNLITQMATPDQLRGRVSAAEMIVNMGGPQVGGLRAGVVAATFGPLISVVAGGVCTVAASVALASNKSLICYTGSHDGTVTSGKS